MTPRSFMHSAQGPIKAPQSCAPCIVPVMLCILHRAHDDHKVTRTHDLKSGHVAILGLHSHLSPATPPVPCPHTPPVPQCHNGGGGGSGHPPIKACLFELDFPSAKCWVKIFFGWVGLRAKRPLHPPLINIALGRLPGGVRRLTALLGRGLRVPWG